MRVLQTVVVALAAGIAAAQTPNTPELRPGQQVDLQVLARTVRAMPNSAQAEKLIAESATLQAAGRTGEARHRLVNAWAMLSGRGWDQKEEFVWSLALRPDRIVADSSLPLTAKLTQIYPAGYKTKAGLKLRATLAESAPDGKVVKELGVFDVASRDLIDQPFGFEADVDGLADGQYRLVAELLEGSASLARMEQSLHLVAGIESQRSSVEKRLAHIQGHDSAKASVRYPFDVARMVNTGRRRLGSADFGIRQDGTQKFDFSQEFHDSAAILKSLEAGKDPVLRAKGDRERRYWFAEAGEVMPYRVYTPTKWDGKSKLKMLFVLHGNSRDHDFYFDRDDGILGKLAEQYGWLVVCPMGYRPNAGYNAGALRTIPGAGTPPAQQGGGGRGGRGGFDPSRQRETELSEKDAMNVLDLVQKEYPIDMTHVYLFGHSAGGTGGWYIAAKYPEKFAGIALSAFGTRADTYPFDRIKGKALMVIIGTKDAPNTVATARAMAKALQDKGYDRYFLEVEGATHETIVKLAEPKVFEFFDKHSRQ